MVVPNIGYSNLREKFFVCMPGKGDRLFSFPLSTFLERWKGVNFAVSPSPYSIRLTQKPPPLHFTRHHTLLFLRKREKKNRQIWNFFFFLLLCLQTRVGGPVGHKIQMFVAFFLFVQTWLWAENENEKRKREVAINALDCSCKNRSHRTAPSQAKVDSCCFYL